MLNIVICTKRYKILKKDEIIKTNFSIVENIVINGWQFLTSSGEYSKHYFYLLLTLKIQYCFIYFFDFINFFRLKMSKFKSKKLPIWVALVLLWKTEKIVYKEQRWIKIYVKSKLNFKWPQLSNSQWENCTQKTD